MPSEIQEAADGGGCSPVRETRAAGKIQPERRFPANGALDERASARRARKHEAQEAAEAVFEATAEAAEVR